MIGRRKFVKILGSASALALVFFNSCKRAILQPTNYALSANQKAVLEEVHEHLFPEEDHRPGARQINSVEYVIKNLSDPQVKDYNKRLILYGTNWTEETSKKLFQKSFIELQHSEKETVLLDIGNFTNGEKWLSNNISYIMEALLADPIYGVNTEQVGWNWLKHKPGFPRPDNRTKYAYL
jgi:gluconate 2-dehydrogenase gamma chain